MRSWLHYLPKWYRRLPDKPRSSYLTEAEIGQANKTMTRRWHPVNTVGTKRVHRDIKSKRAAATSMIAKSGDDKGLEKGGHCRSRQQVLVVRPRMNQALKAFSSKMCAKKQLD